MTSVSAAFVPWRQSCRGTLLTGTWRWALFIAAPPVARWRRKHHCPFARGQHGPPCVPHRACASTTITAAPAPVRPVASGTLVSRAARATQAARAVLRAPGRAAAGLPSPVRAHRYYLCDYDAALRDSLVGGFTHGFRIPSSIQHPTTHNYDNHASAFQHSNFVTTKLSREIGMGRVAGPFDVPTPADVILSPLGVVPKKTPGEYKLIHDLSFPKLDSVNSHIEKVYTEVTYELFDHCLSIVPTIHWSWLPNS